MVRTFSLQAAVQPSVDERQVEREAERTREQFSEQLSGLSVDTETGGVAGAGGGGGGGVPGAGGGALRTGAAAGAASRLGGGGLGGAAAKAAIPVALAGATAFGIKQGIQRLAQASPALQAQSSQFSQAMDLFFKPFGDLLAEKIDPFVDNLTQMALNFNEAVDSQGLPIATAGLAAEIVAARQGGDSTPTGTAVSELFGIEGLVWSDWIDSLDWSTFLSELAWNIFIDTLSDWTRFVYSVDLVEFVTGVDLSKYVTSVDLGNAVNGVDLASFVTGINLGNFIDIPDFLRDGDPGGSVPGRDPDPPDTGSGSSPDPPPTGGGKPGFGGGGDDDDNFADKPDRTPPSERDGFRGDTGDIIGIDSGGAVRSGGMARVHAGERVLPEAQVSDRGEADLAQGDQIVRTLRQIRRDLRALEGDGGDDSAAVVDEIRRLRREMTSGSTPRASEDDVIAALAKLLDRGGGRNPLER
jgi:hypothetical protein